jgi:hypothetical protein
VALIKVATNVLSAHKGFKAEQNFSPTAGLFIAHISAITGLSSVLYSFPSMLVRAFTAFILLYETRGKIS